MSEIELRHTKTLAIENSSKRIFTGQNSYKFFEKFYHFLFVLLLSSVTFGAWLVILLIFKKKYFHPKVSIEGTPNSINREQVETCLKNTDYVLNENEKPLVLINIKKKEFILFTSHNIYYQLLKSDKNLETDLTRGRLSIQQGANIKTKANFIDNLSLMVGDEIIGSLTDGNDERILDLLNAISKDIRERTN